MLSRFYSLILAFGNWNKHVSDFMSFSARQERKVQLTLQAVLKASLLTRKQSNKSRSSISYKLKNFQFACLLT